jgi:hypothetical protein
VRVELVDRSGATVATTVQGFRNVGPLSTLIVKGTLERQGKRLLLRATGLYVE